MHLPMPFANRLGTGLQREGAVPLVRGFGERPQLSLGRKDHQLAGEPLCTGRPASRAGRGDAVDPALVPTTTSPSFFFSAPEKTPRTVCGCHPVATLTSSTVAPSDRRSRAITSACFKARGRLRVGQSLQRRPQTNDQRFAIADLAELVDTGQAISQGEQLPTTESRRAQLVERGDDDLVLTWLNRRLA